MNKLVTLVLFCCVPTLASCGRPGPSADSYAQQQEQIHRLQQQLADMQSTLQAHQSVLNGETPVPFLWAEEMKLGLAEER